jgi:hypothetical protein
MIVLCYGMTKSGSTLGFELCRAALQARGYQQRRLSDAVVRAGHDINFMGDPTPDHLQKTLGELRRQEIIAVKLHGPLDTETRRYLESADGRDRFRVQVSYRDPREIALSLLDAGEKIRQHHPELTRGFARFHSLGEAGAHAALQLEVGKAWASVQAALPLYYDDVAFAPDQVIERIGSHLGLAAFNATERAAIKEMAFDKAQVQKNRAVRNRHLHDLTPAQNEWLLDHIAGARAFIENACINRDYRWMAEQWPGQEWF